MRFLGVGDDWNAIATVPEGNSRSGNQNVGKMRLGDLEAKDSVLAIWLYIQDEDVWRRCRQVG
jgi:hypothetical protein